MILILNRRIDNEETIPPYVSNPEPRLEEEEYSEPDDDDDNNSKNNKAKDGHKWNPDTNLEPENDDDEQNFVPIENFFELEKTVTNVIKRFNTTGEKFSIKFKNLDENNDLQPTLSDIFNAAMEQILANTPDQAYVGASFTHPNLDKMALATFRLKENVNGELMLEQIKKVLQSHEEINLQDGPGQLNITTVIPPVGSGKHNKHRFIKHEQFLEKKRCIIQIRNDDNLCMARAIIVAIAYIHKHDPKYQWESVRKGDTHRYTLQKRKATELMELAGLKDHEEKCGKFVYTLNENIRKRFLILKTILNKNNV